MRRGLLTFFPLKRGWGGGVIRQGRPGGVVVYQYTQKKFAKIPKIHPNILKTIPRYTLYLKFKESDVPNTCI